MSAFRRMIMGLYLQRQTPPVPEERYIEGYASYISRINIKINGVDNIVNVNTSNGYWRYDIDKSLVITSLEGMFNANADEGGYSNNCNITYINLEFIGDTSKNTSMKRAFSDCISMTGIYIPKTFSTKSVRTIRNMFSSCYALKSVDISMFDLSTIPETPNDPTGEWEGCNSNVFYMHPNYGTTQLTKVYLNYIPCRVSSNFFYGCNKLTDVYVNKIKYEFKIHQSTEINKDSLQRIVTALHTWSSSDKPTNINLSLNSTVQSRLTSSQKSTISSKGWTLKTS